MVLKGLKQWLSLQRLSIAVRCKRLAEYLESVYRYYGNAEFRKVDLALVANYLFDNPYAEARRFALLQGDENIYTYGETPLTTLETIVNKCGITASDVVFELGCGRGRSCFWLHSFIKCGVVGIEYNPRFCGKAQSIVRKFSMLNLDFRCEDFLTSDFTGATVIYLYGSCLSDHFLFELTDKLKVLPVGSKLITVSYPLTDYTYEPLFELIEAFEVPFTWGRASVYYQRRL